MDEELVIIAADEINRENLELQNRALAILEEASKKCKDLGIGCSTILATGNPRDCIISAAEDHKADMIVIGSRGLGTLSRYKI